MSTLSPDRGPGNDGRAARANADIKTQINLPWPKAFEIAMNSLKIRFWRSMVTGAGIFLGIAFLAFSGGQLLLQHPPSNPALMDAYRDAHFRQIWLVTMALLVCLVGIMNSMLMSVSERFREIGTMKCLGALDGLIVRLFILEALFMGIVSSTGGCLLGMLILFLVRWGGVGWAGAVHGLSVGQGFGLFGTCVGIGAVLTLIAALMPAQRASHMPPAAALRTEV